MKKVYKITKDGNIIGLWDDFLESISGEKIVMRASRIEFNNDSQMWQINIDMAGKEREVSNQFRERNMALNHEIMLCNNLIAGYPIESYLIPETPRIRNFDVQTMTDIQDYHLS